MSGPRTMPDPPPLPSRDALLVAALGESGAALEAAGAALQAIAASLRPAPVAAPTPPPADDPPFTLGATG